MDGYIYNGVEVFTPGQVSQMTNLKRTYISNAVKSNESKLEEGEHFFYVSYKEILEIQKAIIGTALEAYYKNIYTKVKLWTKAGVDRLAEYYKNHYMGANAYMKQKEEDKVVPIVAEKPMNIADALHITDGMVDGRSLHECLQINERYTDWFPRMVEYGFKENKDFYCKNSKTPSSIGRPSINHDLTINMAKHLAMIQRTPQGMKVRQYLIDFEEAHRQPVLTQEPKTMAEMFFMAAQTMLEIQRDNDAIKTKQTAIEAKQEAQAKEIASIKEILTLRPENWREDSRKIVNHIASKRGNGKDDYQNVWNEIYTVLEARIHVSLGQRKKNRQKRMAEAGASKTAIKNLTKLDIIGDDPKLIESVIAIIKEFAIKEGITVTADHNVIEFKVVER